MNRTQGFALPAYLERNQLEFRIISKLSQTGNNIVFKAEVLSSSVMTKEFKFLVVKQCAKSIEELNETERRTFFQEITVMEQFKRYKEIATIVGYCLKPVCILMKFYELGSLDRLIYDISGRIYNKSIITNILKDVSTGLAILHSYEVAHCDFKPQNVLLEQTPERLTAVLTDFGITKIVGERLINVKQTKEEIIINRRGLTMVYAAPEVIQNFRKKLKIHSNIGIQPGDVYALAATIWEMLTRTRPW
jgi:serine/threonine protein kinase